MQIDALFSTILGSIKIPENLKNYRKKIIVNAGLKYSGFPYTIKSKSALFMNDNAPNKTTLIAVDDAVKSISDI